MLEFTSDKYRACVGMNQEGLLQVYAKEHPFRKQVYLPDGSIEFHLEPTTKSERLLMSHFNRTAVFAATYGGDKMTWWVDREAGACRQSDAICTTREIRGALKNCGFTPQEITKLLTLCRRRRWDHCPRQA